MKWVVTVMAVVYSLMQIAIMFGWEPETPKATIALAQTTHFWLALIAWKVDL